MTLKIKLAFFLFLMGLAVSSQERLIPRDSIKKKEELFLHYFDTNKYGDAINLALRILKTGEQIKSDTLIANSYKFLGTSFMGMDDFDKSILYYEKSLNLYKKLKIDESILDLTVNLAICYAESNDFEKAKIYYNQALKYAVKDIDKANLYNDLGFDYGQNGFYEKAIEYVNKALPLITNNKELEGSLGYSYYTLFHAHYKMGHVDQANLYYSKGINHAKAIDYLDLVLLFYDIRLDQLKNENKNDEAFKIVDSIFKYKKKLKERESLDVYKEVEAKLHLKDNDDKLLLIKNQQKAQILLNITLIALVTILLLLGILVYNKNKLLKSSIQKLNAANKTIKKSLLEKELLEQQLESIQDNIMTDIQDNFGNQLSGIYNSYDIFLTLSKTEDINNERLKDFKRNLEKSLKKLTEDLKEFIWVNKSKNNSLILTLNKLELYVYNLTGDHKDINIELQTVLFKDEYKLPKYWNRQLFLILRETIQNALKYSKATSINISFKIDENNKLTITISDDGKDFKREDILKSPYIFNVKRRAETMGNTIRFEPKKGTIINKVIIEGIIPNI